MLPEGLLGVQLPPQHQHVPWGWAPLLLQEKASCCWAGAALGLLGSAQPAGLAFPQLMPVLAK